MLRGHTESVPDEEMSEMSSAIFGLKMLHILIMGMSRFSDFQEHWTP